MKHVIVLLTMSLLVSLQSNAQQIPCGVDPAAAAAIKERLMNNRRLLTNQQVQQLGNGRSITYLPLTIHNVSNQAGEGRTSETMIMAFLCGLNALYADQDIQFFIHNQVRELTSNFLDANSNTFQSTLVMNQQRVAGTINIYLGRSLHYPASGYRSFYDPNGDHIFLQTPMLSATAETEAHEIGHYLSLPHTFFGWEGIDAEAQYNGVNAPAQVGGRAVELVTRGAGANCQTAGDGFCDTEADYHSTATVTSCNFTPATTDPSGATLQPDESNIMSYYDNSCQTRFSTQQKTAIAADVAIRSWATNNPPSTTTITTTTTLSQPANNAMADITGSTVRLEWAAVSGATWYYVEVFGTNFPGLWIPNTNDVKFAGWVTTGNTYLDLPTNNLTVGSYYAWRVKALNELSTCAPISNYSKFQAVSLATNVADLSIEQQASISVQNNPVQVSDIPVRIQTATALVGSIRVYGMDGRLAIDWSKQQLEAGESLLQLPASNLPNGTYVLVLTTANGLLKEQFVIQR